MTEAPRNRMFDPDTRRSEMARIAALGVRGIKVDFFHSDKPAMIDLYLDIIEDAVNVYYNPPPEPPKDVKGQAIWSYYRRRR